MWQILITSWLGCSGGDADSQAVNEPDELQGSPSGSCVLKMSDPQSGKWGCTDEQGNWVVPPRYMGITAPGTVFYGIVSASERHLIEVRDGGVEIIELTGYQSIRDSGAGVFAYKRDGRWGLLSGQAKEITEPMYVRVGKVSEDLLTACLEDASCGYVDRAGEVRGELKYALAVDFSDGRGRVQNGAQKWGFVDDDGAEVVPPRYDTATDFSAGLAWGLAGDWQLIDPSGEVKATLEADEVKAYADGLAAFRQGKLWGYLDGSGNVVIPPQFTIARSFSEGLAAVQHEVGGLFGYVDKSGKMVIPCQFVGYSVPVERDDKFVMMDFFEGLAVASVEVEAGFGYLDQQGKWTIEPKFSRADPFSGAYAQVWQGNESMWIDRLGREIVAKGHSTLE